MLDSLGMHGRWGDVHHALAWIRVADIGDVGQQVYVMEDDVVVVGPRLD